MRHELERILEGGVHVPVAVHDHCRHVGIEIGAKVIAQVAVPGATVGLIVETEGAQKLRRRVRFECC